jgi:hypothetical protein
MDESFNPLDTRNYGLSVVLSESMFSCCVLDFRRNKFLGLQQLVRNDIRAVEMQPGSPVEGTDFIAGIHTAIPWISNPFRQIKIAFDGGKSTLIPAFLYDPEEKEDYFRFNFTCETDELVCSDHLMPIDAWNVYTANGSVLESTKKVFPKSRVVHCTSLLIESVWINYKNRINSPHVFLHVRDSVFDLMIFDGQQMTYFNSFTFQTPEDVTYYLIFVLEQLNFNPEQIPLVLLGDIDTGKDLAELLLRYVRHVEKGRRNEAYNYSYVLNHLPSQAFFPLLNFFSCGL